MASGWLQRPGLALALANAVFWAACIVARVPLGSDYFLERDSRYRRTSTGIEFHLVTDIDPMLVLAERPFAYPMQPEPIAVQAGLLLNLPAFVVAAFSTELLTNIVLPARGAAWVGTIAFLLIGTAQWVVVGTGVGWLQRRRRRALPLPEKGGENMGRAAEQ